MMWHHILVVCSFPLINITSYYTKHLDAVNIKYFTVIVTMLIWSIIRYMYMRLLTTITRCMRLLSVALMVHVAILENLNEMSHDVASHLGLHCLFIPIELYN